MRRWRMRLVAAAVAVIATLGLVATPAQAAGSYRQGTTAGDGVWVAWYPSGAVVTFSRWNTGAIGASSAFTSVWVAQAALTGQLGNKLNQSVWTIQVQAAWEAANNKCLWVWVPVNGDIETGGYSC